MAAALAVVFAGSYMSCVVQRELDLKSQEQSEEKKEAANNNIKDLCVAMSSYSASLNGVTERRQTTSAVTTQVTTVASTTAESTSETVTSVTTAPPVTETVTAAATVPPAEPAPPAPKPDIQGAVPQSPAVGSEYLNDCAFVGDSHIEGMGAYGIVSKDRVFAKSGLSLAHIDQISVDSIKAANPKHIYIMMGTNGVMYLRWTDMITNYTGFINTLKQSVPEADIYIMSIPPVSADREQKPDVASGKYLNSDVDSYNAELLKMALDNGCYYLDVNSAIKDENGCLSGSTDGIHMPVSTYSTFKDYILTHIAG